MEAQEKQEVEDADVEEDISVKGRTIQAVFPVEAIGVKSLFGRARAYNKHLVGKETEFTAYNMLIELGLDKALNAYFAKHKADIEAYEANKGNGISQKRELLNKVETLDAKLKEAEAKLREAGLL